MKRQLVVGDTIKAQGITATIAEITFQEPWSWRNSWYIEFTDTNGNYRNWKQECDGGNAYDANGNEITDENTNNTTTEKETKVMKTNKKADGQAQLVQIEVNGIKYIQTRPGYYYKNENGKQVRIPKAEWEQAFDEYTQTASDNAEQDAWQAEADAEKQAREQKQADEDKAAEKTMNKQAKAKKTTKKSKDIAFEGTFEYANEEFHITLTAKQVRFIKRMPEDGFYEHGLDSALWIDVFCDTIADEFNPMAVGAMVSTLREKGLVNVVSDRVNGRKAKWMAFTALGQMVAKELGLN